jgi:hypothetical protein
MPMPDIGWIMRRLAGLAAAVAVLAGCAQAPGTVGVGIGTAAYRFEAARPYAELYAPYAKMAALAYTDPLTPQGKGGQFCPTPARISAKGDPRLLQWFAELGHERWRCLFGAVGATGCPQGIRCVDGLQYHVWRRNDCTEAVIAFRGSDAGDIGDWISNLRWFVVRPVFDQYDQAQHAIGEIIDKLIASGCRPRRIFATGHSLGGGLGQHVAFADRRIDYVYAFDPSPVTAFFAVPLPTRMASAGKLGIDRVYEAGEILSLPRYLVSGLFATSPCQPRVRIVRFHTLTAPSLVERHRIANLTEGIVQLSKTGRPAPPPVAFDQARSCDFVRPEPG